VRDRVAAFSIGFGPELGGFTDRRGTRWKLSAIPLGGYVRFEGDENVASLPDSKALADTPLSERQGLFHFAPLWKRIAVVAAGPVANFISPFSFSRPCSRLLAGRISCPLRKASCPAAPRRSAGIRPGDRILSVDGGAIDSFSELQSLVMLSADEPLAIEVDRAGERVALTAVPQRQEQPDRLGGTHRIGVLGITAGQVDFRRDDAWTALQQGGSETVLIIDRTLTYIGRLVRGPRGARSSSAESSA
jgi:regulator of sigma E protease